MRLIELYRRSPHLSMWTMVDDEDLVRLAGYRWNVLLRKRGAYAVRWDRSSGVQRPVYMHREVLGLPPGRVPEVDHRNHDGLDNRRGNLRCGTHSQNMGNARGQLGGLSQYKGVTLFRNGRWTAHLRCRGLGYFATEEEAARAYDAAAIAVFGQFALLNFPINELLEV